MTILITGAGSGLGEGAAIGMARNGHQVIAAAQTWPQATALRAKAEKLGLASLRVEKLDVLDPYDVKQACQWDFDILANNAGIGEGGPIAEIPLDLVRKNFEVNFFAPLALTQQVVRKWVAGKIQWEDRLHVVHGRSLQPAWFLRICGDQARPRSCRRGHAGRAEALRDTGADHKPGRVLDGLQRGDGRERVPVA